MAVRSAASSGASALLPGARPGRTIAACRRGSPGRGTEGKGLGAVIKYVYEIDYPVGQKRAYLEWVRSIADTLQAPGELKRLASYDNVFSATPHRVVESRSTRSRTRGGTSSGRSSA